MFQKKENFLDYLQQFLHFHTKARTQQHYKLRTKTYCYIVSVKVQFIYLFANWSKLCHVPVHKTSCSATGPQSNIYWPSIIKWVQYACVSIVKFQSSLFLNFLLNIYSILFTQFWFQIKFTPITGQLFILWHLYTI